MMVKTHSATELWENPRISEFWPMFDDSPSHLIHFLMRYSDSLRGVDTISEHTSIVENSGYCWFGKFGLGISSKIVDYTERQLAEDTDTFIYLANGAKVDHVAKVIGLVAESNQISAPEKKKVPKYYRNEWCTVWFKLTEFRNAPDRVLSDLVLFNDTSTRPPLTTSRALMYVTTRIEYQSKRKRLVLPVGFR